MNALLKQRALLSPATTTRLCAVRRFVAADVITLGNELGGRKIGHINDGFRKNFLGVVEEGIPGHDVTGRTLDKPSTSYQILDMLGDRDERRGIIALGHFFEIVGLRETGPGLWDGTLNIGYARSPVDQNFWALCWNVMPINGKLEIGARPANDAYNWDTGIRVFGG